MSLMLGTKKIAGLGLNGTSFPLLGHFWSDHIINDISFLKADSFSWHSGDVYTVVYNHLVDDLNGATVQTDVINGISVEYMLAKDGHKIVLDDDTDINHLHVKELYESFGASWYYVLTTINKSFKLPRTKYGFTGIDNNPVGTSIDNIAPGSGIKSTQMYLYFFVGNYNRDAIEQTAGYAQELTELKANKNLDNLDEAGQAILDSKVTLNTDQTITGKKIFDSSTESTRTDVAINSCDSDVSTWSGSLIFRKNGVDTGYAESYYNKSAVTKDSVMQITAHNSFNENEIYASIAVGVRGSDGSRWATAPTTTDLSSSDDQIVTTSYINNKFQVVSVLPINPDPNVFYLILE